MRGWAEIWRGSTGSMFRWAEFGRGSTASLFDGSNGLGGSDRGVVRLVALGGGLTGAENR